MGYTTDFDGGFDITPSLARKDHTFLTKLSGTRRMARNVDSKYGVEGEFYVDGVGGYGQGQESNIINFNDPPSTQPGLWCQWVPNKEGTRLEWNGGEKFYRYTEWLQYLIDKVLTPRGYVLNGECEWQGEDHDDFGIIKVKANVVTTAQGRRTYDSPNENPPEDPPVTEVKPIEGSPKARRTKII